MRMYDRRHWLVSQKGNTKMFKSVAFAAAAAAALTFTAAPATAATTVSGAGTSVPLTLFPDGSAATGDFSFIVGGNGAFTANYTFDNTFFTSALGALSASLASTNGAMVTFTSAAIDGMTGSTTITGGGTKAAIFYFTSPVSMGSHSFSVSGVFTPTASAKFAKIAGTVSLSAVPEPATWALMILGFGAVGFAMRRRNDAVRSTRATLTFA